MKLKSLALLCGVLLTGCQSTQTIDISQPTTQSVATLTAVDSQKVLLPSSTKISVSNTTQRLENSEIISPVVKLELPIYQGALDIELVSFINKEVFSPVANIYDNEGNVIQAITADSFRYEKPRLAHGNRLVTEFSFFPPNNIEAAYLVIYTTDAELAKVTEVIHPARLDAEARGNYFPEAKDIPIPHGLTGELQVEITPYSTGSFFNLNSKSAPEQKQSVTAVKKAPVTVSQDTQQYFHQSIQKAVAEDNISKALSLLDEAKALGVEGAQEIFVQAVEKR